MHTDTHTQVDKKTTNISKIERKQKRNPNQINICCDQPLPSKQHKFH